MLAITTKTQYAIIALLDLADHYPSDIVQIGEIVQRNDIPKNYLEQILNLLTKAGLVKSIRGKKGGYILGNHPEKISILKIIECVEGRIELRNSRFCSSLDEILEKIEVQVAASLSISLADLLQRQKSIDNQILFTI